MKINHVSFDENVRQEIHPMKINHVSFDENVRQEILIFANQNLLLYYSILKIHMLVEKMERKITDMRFLIYFLSFHLH